MSVALLDVNVLLALMDGAHTAHDQAHGWASEHLVDGWATCALTQNGFVRIISQPRYPNAVSAGQAVDMLGQATAHEAHEFWPCDVSISDAVDAERLVGPAQLTDAYLLALAAAQDGVFVTFDRQIDLATAHGATPRHLLRL